MTSNFTMHTTQWGAPAVADQMVFAARLPPVDRQWTLLASSDDLQTFTVDCRRFEPGLRAGPTALIAAHEADEWLADARSLGRLRLTPDH